MAWVRHVQCCPPLMRAKTSASMTLPAATKRPDWRMAQAGRASVQRTARTPTAASRTSWGLVTRRRAPAADTTKPSVRSTHRPSRSSTPSRASSARTTTVRPVVTGGASRRRSVAAAEHVRGVMVEQAPGVALALEEVGGQDGGDGDPTPHLGQDVLGAGHPPAVAEGDHVDVGDGEAHLRGVLEDGAPGVPHGRPAGEEGPPGMHALDVLPAGPHAFHLGQVEVFEGAVEARVGLPDFLSLVGHPAGQVTTRSSPSRARGSAVSRSPTQGPAVQMPLAGS